MAGHLLHIKEKNPAILIYCDIIHTKVSRPETPREFFKGYYIRKNSRQTPSPGVARGLASPFAVFIYPNIKKSPQGIPP